MASPYYLVIALGFVLLVLADIITPGRVEIAARVAALLVFLAALVFAVPGWVR